MAQEIQILWSAITDFPTLASLHSLADGNWWHSEEFNDASPSNQFIRFSWELVFASTPVAGDFAWFKLFTGDEAASNEILTGNVTKSEAEVSVAADVAAIDQAPAPQWTQYWATNHGTTFKGLHIVGMHGHTWELGITVRGEALTTGNRLRYQYGTAQLQ